MMDVTTKYAQRDVVTFWQTFGRQGLQAAEAIMIARYVPPPARVLDLGCGPGRAALALAPKGYDVTGLDITWVMARAAHDAYRQAGLRPDVMQADIRAIPCRGEHYDVVLVLIAALQHVPGRQTRQGVFRQIVRVLRPGGTLILALDNVAPAFTCYIWWGWQRLRHARRNRQVNGKGSATTADQVLVQRHQQMSAAAWHLRGILRTLRWRTWSGLRDWLRTMHLLEGERGDTAINQVSLTATPGNVYYHIYEHAELLDDARAAGLVLLDYHSSRELGENRTFAPRIRQLDKQVLYAFRRPN